MPDDPRPSDDLKLARACWKRSMRPAPERAFMWRLVDAGEFDADHMIVALLDAIRIARGQGIEMARKGRQ